MPHIRRPPTRRAPNYLPLNGRTRGRLYRLAKLGTQYRHPKTAVLCHALAGHTSPEADARACAPEAATTVAWPRTGEPLPAFARASRIMRYHRAGRPPEWARHIMHHHRATRSLERVRRRLHVVRHWLNRAEASHLLCATSSHGRARRAPTRAPRTAVCMRPRLLPRRPYVPCSRATHCIYEHHHATARGQP